LTESAVMESESPSEPTLRKDMFVSQKEPEPMLEQSYVAIRSGNK